MEALMKTKLLSLVLLGSLGPAINLTAVAEVAAGADEPLAQSVSYRDLDLSRPADAGRLYGRIGRAAARVCEPFNGRELHMQALRRQCVDQAISAAVARVNHPNLTARHAARTPLRIAANSNNTAP
jgi:UrcA family protein